MKYIKDVAIAETIFINIIKENRKNACSVQFG